MIIIDLSKYISRLVMFYLDLYGQDNRSGRDKIGTRVREMRERERENERERERER